MRAIFDSMSLPAFRQESELAFIDAEEAAFSMELLEKNCTADFGAGDDAKLRFLSIKREPTQDEYRWLEQNIKGTLMAGYDVGRKKDESALFILDGVAGRFEARALVRLANTEFAVQENIIARAIKCGVRQLAIDSTGIGLPLAEKLQKTFGDRILPLHFTSDIKSRLVSTTKMLLMDKKLALPLERNLLSQMRSIERKVTDSGNIIFHAPRSGGCHADIAWAIMLACRAAQAEIPGTPHYEKVSRRDGWKLRTKDSWRY